MGRGARAIVPGGRAAAAGNRRMRLRREADRLERRRRNH